MPASPCGATHEPDKAMTDFSLHDLERIVAGRADSADPESWTAKLAAAGIGKASGKLGEEAVETVIAAISQDDQALVAESADLLPERQ